MADEVEKGKFAAFKNPKHEPGGKQPAFKGAMTFGDANDERHIAFWPHKSKATGQTFFRIKVGASAAEQIDGLTDPGPGEHENRSGDSAKNDSRLDLKPGEGIAFPNSNKPSGSNQPDYYGYLKPNSNAQILKLDTWAKNDRYGKPMLSGNAKPIPQRELKQTPPLEPEHSEADEKAPARKKARRMSR